uniref:Kazal-like domain-containing protein n=1 Tax=Terrapene triunguis TaxID=2587831 RepID=A0A674IPT6_9SAUR
FSLSRTEDSIIRVAVGPHGPSRDQGPAVRVPVPERSGSIKQHRAGAFSQGDRSPQYSVVSYQQANCSQYPQTKGRVLCTRSSQMVCGTDGVTHSSECMLCDRIL